MIEERKNEHGQALIILVLAMVALLGFTALAIDGGMAYAERRHAQNSADASALASALSKLNHENWYQIGLERAESNGFDNNGDTNTVVVWSPPKSGPYTGNTKYVQVVITSTVNTAFMHLIFPGVAKNRVEAVARYIPGNWGPLFPGDAIVGLKPNGCSVVWGHGSDAGTDVMGGGIFINSDDPDCAFSQNGSRSINVPDGKINVVGGANVSPGKILPDESIIQTGAVARTYPPTEYIDPPTCISDTVKTGNSLSPGNYTGTFPPNGVEILQPGIYCIDGDFKLNNNQILSGNNVLIYMKSGDISWNGGARINLTAPAEGEPYQGLLIFRDIVDPSVGNHGECTVTLNGNADSTYQGTIYAPSCDINLLGTGASDGWHSQIIGYTVEIGGDKDLFIYYVEDEVYTGDNPPKIELAQ
jgi:hypothetical protein